ncbi:MAG TPA: hypothetical protein VGI81_25635, partial [Tepidisphaeraceae bacterium]
MGDSLHWWLNTDSGLLARIGIGASIFAALAIVDLVRRGREATRWREYLFLLVAALFGMAYGVINDRVASGVSWEYFYYGKGLDEQLGPQVPPDPAALRWAACKVGLKATWSVGLVIGVALLIANNPRKGRPQLPYRTLMQLLPIILLAAALFALIGAIVGSRGWLVWTSADLRALLRENLFRPHRFLTVHGMNLGGYVGGALATVGAVAWILRQR